MEFSLSDEQRGIVDAARQFAKSKLAPSYAKRDVSGEFSRDLTREMGQLGFIAPEQSEEFGGSGVDYLTSGLVIEAMASGDFNMAYVQLLASLNSQILERYATADIAQKWIPKICAGEAILGVALTEPGGGSDAANLQLKADKVEGGYRLTGEKASISMADQADIMVVFARTGDTDSRAKGVSAFLVEMKSAGISTGRYDDMGQHCVGRGSIFFDAAFVSDDHQLGEENKAFSQVMRGLILAEHL